MINLSLKKVPLSGGVSPYRGQTIGTLSNYDDDDEDNFKKQ